MVGGGKDREEMRLIDADKLIEELKIKTVSKDAHIISIANAVVDLVNNQPTAFDTEKVVEQLKEAEMDISSLGHCAVYADDAIKIVLKGGTTD